MNDTARALIGRTLGGRFKLTSFIGEGAMASVFRGEQSDEPREVAVKVMHKGLAEDRSFLGRFQREARAAARIDHRNTVRILEHGRDRDVVYIAMELVSGQDLFEVLSRERRLSEARAARIVLQVCAALDAAHQHGVVHRDLKPENVMLVRDPDHPEGDLVKVLDFGIAKLLERGRNESGTRADSVITLVGTVIGTPEYMSPEQARGNPPVDARSDVYAAGVLLYQLVTGRLPFRGDSAIEVILQHIERVPTAPSAIVPGLHPELEQIILKALAKWPAQRHQTARELADALAALLPELEESPRQATAALSADDDLDEAPPTVRMLPEEACFTPTEIGPAPVLRASALPPPPPLPPVPHPSSPAVDPDERERDQIDEAWEEMSTRPIEPAPELTMPLLPALSAEWTAPAPVLRVSHPPALVLRVSHPPAPVLRVSHPPAPVLRMSHPPAPVLRASHPPAPAPDAPSPWAAPVAPADVDWPTELSFRSPPWERSLVGWWLLLIAVAVLCAAIWLTR